MSYVRFGWGPNDEFPGTPEAKLAGPSSLYMFGTTDPDGTRSIECCGCLLVGGIGGYSPRMTDKETLLGHLDEHRKAGHIVHDYVQPAIEAEFEKGGWMNP